LVWDQQDSTTKRDLCRGWNTAAKEMLLDSFMEGLDSGIVTRSEAREFFDAKCA
jgi:hypothetical protein